MTFYMKDYGSMPREAAVKLSRMAGIKSFVETGTQFGKTAVWAASHFPCVHTIELCPKTFHEIQGVHTHLGNSKDILPEIIQSVGDSVFWLDGHFPGAGRDDQCPVLEELEILKNREGDIIMIDDFRLFATIPPSPLNPDQWPTVLDIMMQASGWKSPRFVQIMNDVIYILPPRLRSYFLGIRDRDNRKTINQ